MGRSCDLCGVQGTVLFNVIASGKIDCDACSGNGKHYDDTLCHDCNGRGWVRCPKCLGTGELDDDDD